MTPKNEMQRLNYAVWDDKYLEEKPYTIISVLPQLGASEHTNMEFELGPEELITDIRGEESGLSLDANGFEFITHDFPNFDPFDPVLLEREMYPVFRSFLREHMSGVDQVHFFDHRVRSNDIISGPGYTEVQDRSQILPPARGVHIDQSPGGALKRARILTRDDDRLPNGRIRIINIWFPYEHPVEDCPLALCDGTTVREQDLLIADHVTRSYIGETVFPMYSSQSKWYYLSEQKRNEVLIFKIFDSDESVPARYVPHTSFDHKSQAKGARPRKSFEIRALVFTYPEA